MAANSDLPRKPTEDELFARPRTVEVRSATDPTKSYTVTLAHCPCPGFHFRGRCSHVLTAVEAYGGEVVPKRRINDDDGAPVRATD